VRSLRKKRLFASVFPVASLLVAGVLTVGVASGASASSWWQPGQITAWAYMIGYNSPITVPSFISSPTGSDPNTAVDIDLGDQDGMTSTCYAYATAPCPLTDGPTETSVNSIHAANAHAICYVDVGTDETWRSDTTEFSSSEIGGPLSGWPDEYFINVNDWSTPVSSGYETLQTIMTNRFALCKAEGFDAIEADNVDAYTDGNLDLPGGATITMAGDEQYVQELAQTAHSMGLAYFLKNEINGDSFITNEVGNVDGEIVEQCWQYQECSALDVFVQDGKPIMNVEYDSPSESTLCSEANAFPMASNSENLDVTSISYSCSEYGSGEQPYSSTSTPSSTAPSPTTPPSSTTTTIAPRRTTTTTVPPTTSTTRSYQRHYR